MQFLKKSIKKAFTFFNLEIRHNRKQGEERRTTLIEVLTHIGGLGFRPKTVIDVGVATGTYELYKTFPSATHLLIEPLSEFEDDLRRISSEYKVEYAIAAAGSRRGITKINVHPDLLGSSIFKEQDGLYVDGISREVPVVTVDDLCRDRKLSGPFLIKIDTQGAEKLVLEGAKKTLKETEVVILEVNFFPFHKDSPEFYEVVHFMKEVGFVVYDIFGGYNRPLDYALASVDAVFVKEKGMFRKSYLFAPKSIREELNRTVLKNARNVKNF
jgi:FkbM family methyltransferase